MGARVLLLCGSLNQTTMLHQVARELHNCEVACTPFYADGTVGRLARAGALKYTILGGGHRAATLAYLKSQNLPIDPEGRSSAYDLVITGTDLVVPRNLRGKPMVLIQEGIMEPARLTYHLVRHLRLPRYLANTAATGLSGAYDTFCVASLGYKDQFRRRGVPAERMHVTGIPNFDNIDQYRDKNFPFKGFALATTSNARESFKWENRKAFLATVLRLAEGRPLFVRLHPGENLQRSAAEIRRWAPQATVLTEGNTMRMAANCDVLITTYSSLAFVGLALGKPVHSRFKIEELRRLVPLQNGGRSAGLIAELCHTTLEQRQRGRRVFAPRLVRRPIWRIASL